MNFYFLKDDTLQNNISFSYFIHHYILCILNTLHFEYENLKIHFRLSQIIVTYLLIIKGIVNGHLECTYCMHIDPHKNIYFRYSRCLRQTVSYKIFRINRVKKKIEENYCICLKLGNPDTDIYF